MSTNMPGDDPSRFLPTGADQPGRAAGISPGTVVVTLIGLALLGLMVWAVSTGSNTSNFLAKMHASPYGTHGSTDAELIQMGYNVCGAFDNGKTVKDIVYSFWGMTQEQRGYLMGAAVSTMCTEHQDALVGEFNAYNGY